MNASKSSRLKAYLRNGPNAEEADTPPKRFIATWIWWRTWIAFLTAIFGFLIVIEVVGDVGYLPFAFGIAIGAFANEVTNVE